MLYFICSDMAELDHAHSSNLALYQRLDQDDIKELREIFKSHKEQKFTIIELENILEEFGISLSPDQIKSLFLKINTSRDDHCDWDEFVSHLLFEFQCDDPNNQKGSLTLPIVDKPIIHESCHRFLIIRMRLNPVLLPDRTLNYTHGSYITVSKDGTVNFWTQNFELQRTEVSKNTNLKVAKTWILDLVCLPDVNIICTSSIENDLRFYDISGSNWFLKLIVNLPFAVSAMNYWFGKKTKVDSKIILGDFGGNVTLLEFNPEMRGPFRSVSGVSVSRTTWKAFCEGIIPEFRFLIFPNKHEDVVRQVDYCEPFNCVVSCAECREIPVGRMASPGLVLSDLGVQRKETIIRMTRVVSCFAYESSLEIFATGGPDCVLRLWRPNLPNKATAILHGHNFGITFIFFQDSCQRIYSMDTSKVVKVWAMSEEILQTYILVSTMLTDLNPAAHFYNDETGELTIANMKICTVKCCPRLNLEKTDGYTHSQAVSVLLYNTLFKTIVSCGFDSCIIIWEPWTGKRQNLIKSAHTRMFYGEILNVEITAGCFDIRQLYLLTGARNGTLKMWNLKDGICMRNLAIEYMCEVAAVFWLPQRILAVGWNKHIVEFPDRNENDVSGETNWVTCHSEDIFSAAVRMLPNDKFAGIIVTGSFAGGLVFWNLQTGQPYRKIEVTNPRMEVKIVSRPTEQKNRSGKSFGKPRKSDTSGNFLEKSLTKIASSVTSPALERRRTVRSRRISVVQMPFKLQVFRSETIHSMIFLNTRPSLPDVGNIFLSLENGKIQVFSDHMSGGYIDSFNAIHMAGDCVISMLTDDENRYLITGTAFGYIKVWLIRNYCIQPENMVHINMPKLRLQFPFLITTSSLGRAKRTVRNQKDPLLINSFTAHKNMSITGFAFINECKLLVSSSTDHSVRIWTLSGRYIGTLGSPLKWNKLSSKESPDETFDFRIPPDIKRIASSTTLQVLNGVQVPDLLQEEIANRRLKKKRENEKKKDGSKVDTTKQNVQIYGEPISASVATDLKWIAPNIEKSTVSETNQPFLPPLNYRLDELISTPFIPEVFKKWKEFDFFKSSDQ